jgi:hypothetical protein
MHRSERLIEPLGNEKETMHHALFERDVPDLAGPAFGFAHRLCHPNVPHLL